MTLSQQIQDAAKEWDKLSLSKQIIQIARAKYDTLTPEQVDAEISKARRVIDKEA